MPTYFDTSNVWGSNVWGNGTTASTATTSNVVSVWGDAPLRVYTTTNDTTTSATAITPSVLTLHVPQSAATNLWSARIQWDQDLGSSNWVSLPRQEVPRRVAAKRRFFEQLRPLLRNHHGSEPRAVRSAITEQSLTEAEVVALGTLKTYLSPDQWRSYLRGGTVTVLGKSGLSYVVPRGGAKIRVFGPHGTVLCTLCVHANGNIPPSDEVLARVLMIHCDEPDIWRRSNVQGVGRGPMGTSIYGSRYPWTPEILAGLRAGRPAPALAVFAA